MRGRIIKQPLAIRDLDEAATYIQRHGTPRRAVRFLRAANKTLARLAGMPGIGTRYNPDEPLYADLRYFPISGFPKYIVFYHAIEVIRVFHGARDLDGLLADDFDIDPDAPDEEQ